MDGVGTQQENGEDNELYRTVALIMTEFLEIVLIFRYAKSHNQWSHKPFLAF